MKCPVCKKESLVDVGSPSDEFSAELDSCGYCGAYWTHNPSQNKAVLVNFGSARNTSLY